MRYTAKQLAYWGFRKVVVPPEDNDGVNTYSYYVLDLDDSNYTICLISSPLEKGVRMATVSFFEGEKPLSKEFIEAIIKEFKK